MLAHWFPWLPQEGPFLPVSNKLIKVIRSKGQVGEVNTCGYRFLDTSVDLMSLPGVTVPSFFTNASPQPPSPYLDQGACEGRLT